MTDVQPKCSECGHSIGIELSEQYCQMTVDQTPLRQMAMMEE